MISLLDLVVGNRAGALSATTFLVINQFFVLIQEAFFEFIVALLVGILILIQSSSVCNR